MGLELLLLAKPSGDGVVLAETLDDEGLRILDLVAVEALEPDHVEVVVRLRDVQHLTLRNLAVDVGNILLVQRSNDQPGSPGLFPFVANDTADFGCFIPRHNYLSDSGLRK